MGHSNDMPSTQPTVFVLFGATGDLAKRMVLPAFYQLAQHGLMPESWVLIGNGRGDVSHEDFQGRVRKALDEFGGITVDEKVWADFAGRLRFAGGGFDQDDPGSLLDVLTEARDLLGAEADYIHYLAIPPVAFEGITKGLSAHQLLDGSRVVYEKPYGTSPESFKELDSLVLSVMKEEQVYRIDHFLGKEATAEHPRTAVRQPDDRADLEQGACGPGADRCAGNSGRGRSGGVLRRHRGAAGHGGHPPVPGRGRDRHGTADRLLGREPAGRPGIGAVGVPAVGRRGRGAGPGRRVSRPARGGRRLDHRHLRRGPAVGRHRPLARCPVPAPVGQVPQGERTAGVPADAQTGRGR